MGSNNSYSEEIVINDFDDANAKNFRKQVFAKSRVDPNMPIEVYIDSHGGYVDSLNNMLATMRQVPNQFVTVCIGKAMSCGAVLLAAGDFRFCDEGSRVMVHEVSAGAFGHNDDIKNRSKEIDRMNKQLMTFTAKRCGKTYKELKDRLRENEANDLFMPAEDAKKFGIVDFVGMPAITPIVSYSIEVAPKKEYEPVENFVQTLEQHTRPSGSKKKTKKKKSKKKKKTTKKKKS